MDMTAEDLYHNILIMLDFNYDLVRNRADHFAKILGLPIPTKAKDRDELLKIAASAYDLMGPIRRSRIERNIRFAYQMGHNNSQHLEDGSLCDSRR